MARMTSPCVLHTLPGSSQEAIVCVLLTFYTPFEPVQKFTNSYS